MCGEGASRPRCAPWPRSMCSENVWGGSFSAALRTVDPYRMHCSCCTSARQSRRHCTHTPRSRRPSARRMLPDDALREWRASHAAQQKR
eukprot:366143-Chlamydomonas_euryale.AAC.1